MDFADTIDLVYSTGAVHIIYIYNTTDTGVTIGFVSPRTMKYSVFECEPQR